MCVCFFPGKLKERADFVTYGTKTQKETRTNTTTTTTTSTTNTNTYIFGYAKVKE